LETVQAPSESILVDFDDSGGGGYPKKGKVRDLYNNITNIERNR